MTGVLDKCLVSVLFYTYNCEHITCGEKIFLILKVSHNQCVPSNATIQFY